MAKRQKIQFYKYIVIIILATIVLLSLITVLISPKDSKEDDVIANILNRKVNSLSENDFDDVSIKEVYGEPTVLLLNSLPFSNEYFTATLLPFNTQTDPIILVLGNGEGSEAKFIEWVGAYEGAKYAYEYTQKIILEGNYDDVSTTNSTGDFNE